MKKKKMDKESNNGYIHNRMVVFYILVYLQV
jgi:hypothetical protein